jgi:hypothetical protein
MPSTTPTRRAGARVAVGLALLVTGCSSPAAPSAHATISTPAPAPVATPTVAGSGGVPAFDPNGFVTAVTNPYYPLTPGMTWVYQGVRDGVSQRDEVVVTNRTKLVNGVTAVVVTDVASHDGTLLEKTEDWFAQDRQGNVWYLGEDTATYSDGKLESTEGSWTAGVGGAQPGIIMPAHPVVTSSYRQEYLSGHAEDTSWVVQDGQTVHVPYGTLTGAIRTLEFTQLEPDVIDTKYYAPGIGIVKEVSVTGPHELAELVSFTKP